MKLFCFRVNFNLILLHPQHRIRFSSSISIYVHQKNILVRTHHTHTHNIPKQINITVIKSKDLFVLFWHHALCTFSLKNAIGISLAAFRKFFFFFLFATTKVVWLNDFSSTSHIHKMEHNIHVYCTIRSTYVS